MEPPQLSNEQKSRALTALIVGRIQAHGPMSVAAYMELCLLHPDYGYYATRDPFGVQGDFTTAPEISQIFGEICGLALGQAWLDQNQPARPLLAEPGPGRGTLMADMARALQRVPGFLDQARICLVEASAHLRKVQARTVPRARHFEHLDALPEGPLFLVANEFLDALPVRQFERVAQGWAERMITVNARGLAWALGPAVELPQNGKPGEIWEDRPATAGVIRTIAARIARHGGAAILIDYGAWDGRGDTLQALRGHQAEDPLAHPGMADLTAHVDFATVAAAAHLAGAAVSAPVTQGVWLHALGAGVRAEALARAGDKGAMAALHRLTYPAEMGDLFKVIAIWPRGAAPVPGFAALNCSDQG